MYFFKDKKRLFIIFTCVLLFVYLSVCDFSLANKYKLSGFIFITFYSIASLGFIQSNNKGITKTCCFKRMRNVISSIHDKESKIKGYREKIKRQKEYLEAIFNSLTDGIITISQDCKIISSNPAVSAWVGLEEEQIKGRFFPDLIKCKCSANCTLSREQISQICPIISQSERFCPTEARVINLNTRTEKYLGISSSLISGIKGEKTRVVLLRDITENKKMERMREDFIGTLTHDLKVPILAESNTIKLFLRGTLGELSDLQKTAMENMFQCNKDLLSLVNQLLDSYRYESTEVELYKESVNLGMLIDECVAEIEVLAKKNDQILKNLILPDFCELSLDRKEIKRVFLNLINNSISYTQVGGLIVINAEKNENEVIVRVSDNGKGIQKEDLELIFYRFYTNSGKFKKAGTGLGLYLSRQIIEKHDGKIWAESTQGWGSTFYVSLPLIIKKI